MKNKQEAKDLRYFLDQVRELQRISKRLHRLYEIHCERDLTKSEEKRKERLEGEATKIAERIGFNVYFQRDPRGCPLFLITPDMSDYLEGIPITA